MKLFGFLTTSENRFVHYFCNFVIFSIIIVVFSLTCFSPIVSVAYVKGEEAIYLGNPKNNNISLMINVYWGTEFLDRMLEILKENDVKTTFFVGGYWVAKNNDYLLKIFNDGHEIANHGYNHKDHSKISYEQNKDEIYMNHQLIKSLINYDMNLFAPPSGAYNNTTLTVSSSLGYKTILWSKDTIDWRDKSEDLIFKRSTENLQNGDLILMHPTEATASILDRIIKEIKRQGFNITTVSKNLS